MLWMVDGDGTRVCFEWFLFVASRSCCFGIQTLCVNTFARQSELLVASAVSVLKLSCGLAMCLEMVQSSELLMGLLDLADISQIVIFFAVC